MTRNYAPFFVPNNIELSFQVVVVKTLMGALFCFFFFFLFTASNKKVNNSYNCRVNDLTLEIVNYFGQYNNL